MSYGLSPWGLGPWGMLGTLSVVSARVLTTHSVEVTLAEAPRSQSVIGEGDAINPQSWFIFTASDNWTVLASRKITSTKFELRTLQPLDDWRITHTVGSYVLVRQDGVSMAAPYTYDFPGVVVASDMLRAPKGPYDLMNVGAIMADGGGTLVVGSTGNYNQQFGDEMLLKLALRRLTTSPGAYFHIPASDYGVGLKSKEPLRATSLMSLKLQIEQEMVREPGIVACRANLQYDPANGLLVIGLKLQTDQGEERSLNLTARNS